MWGGGGTPWSTCGGERTSCGVRSLFHRVVLGIKLRSSGLVADACPLTHRIGLNSASPVTLVPDGSHITKLEGLEIFHALLGLFLFITVRQPGILDHPTTQSLYPGVSLKKYFKSCNKITSKGRGAVRSHQGAEKRPSSPPPGFQPGQEGEPLRLSRYIPAVGEVRGQGVKVPVCAWGGGHKWVVRRCPLLPTRQGTAQSHQAALFEQGP